jgi:hypothetical protein
LDSDFGTDGNKKEAYRISRTLCQRSPILWRWPFGRMADCIKESTHGSKA